jgi:CheY-like chemotaxis protein
MLKTRKALAREDERFESLSHLILAWYFRQTGKGKPMTNSFENSSDSEIYADEPAARGTILIVDDEPTVLAMIGEMIAAFGYRPITATNGVAALQVAAQDRVDLIISDINMPGISGLELLGRIKQESPGIPVFLMSGDHDALVMAARTSQVDGILSKPFFVEDLNRMIERALNPLSVVA